MSSEGLPKLLDKIHRHYGGRVSHTLIRAVLRYTLDVCATCKWNAEHEHRCMEVCSDIMPSEESFVEGMIDRKEAMIEARD